MASLNSRQKRKCPASCTITPGKVELGQGILTALSQIAADELDVSLARLRVQPTRVRYIGPPEMASPAPGSLRQHQELQRAILDQALAV